MAGQTQINLSWTDNSNNEDGFKIERSADGSTGWTEIGVVNPNIATFSNTGLAPGVTYYYRVRAYNTSGNSDYSNVANAQTTLCTVSNLVATPVGQPQINLSWTDNCDNEDGFKIERSLDGTTNWIQIAAVGANVTSYANTGLTCGTTYAYRVRAVNVGGDLASANTATARTVVCPPSPAPSNLVATAAGAAQINLSWKDNSINEDGFKIERSPDGTNGWTQIATVGANTTSYTNTSLTCKTTYYYRVRATNAGGDSAYTNVANTQTATCIVPPSKLTAAVVGPTQINLSWTDNSKDEVGFKIERSPDGATDWAEIATVGVNVKTYANNTGLTCRTIYYYRVRAYSAGGNSAYTNTASAQTAECIVDPIFADGFESGDLSKWSSSTGVGCLGVTPAAALAGTTKGLQINITSNNSCYVTDETPTAEPRYRARFYFDPNTIAMKSNDAHYIFYGYSGAATVVLRVEFRFASNKYQLSAGLVDDKATWKSTSWVPISDAPHRVELDWQASATPTAKNGSLTFWVDGVQSKALTKIDNDTLRIDRIQLGAVFGLDTGTRGAYFFDEFGSHRVTAFGLARDGATDVAPELAMITDTVAISDTAAEIIAPTVLFSTTVQPGADHHLAGQVDDLHVNVNFAADAAVEPVTAAIALDDERITPDGYTGVGSPFAIQLQAADGAAALPQPFTVIIDYGDLLDSLPMPSALTLQAWNADTETWTLAPATVNVEAHTITAVLSQPATVALFQPEETGHEQIYMPVIQQ